MKNFAPSTQTRLLAVTAVLAALLLTVSNASAGTQMPYWKKMKLQGMYTTPTTTTTVTTPSPIVVIDEVVPPTNNDESSVDDSYNPGGMNGGNGHQGPKAVPTPSAIAGGLAMIGLIAGRRRNREDQAA